MRHPDDGNTRLMRYLFSRWGRSSGRVSVGEPTAALAEEYGVQPARLRIGPAAAGHPFCRLLIELMEERDLLTRVFMALQLCPPLVVSRDEIDQMVTIVDDSLSLAEREFGFA